MLATEIATLVFAVQRSFLWKFVGLWLHKIDLEVEGRSM